VLSKGPEEHLGCYRLPPLKESRPEIRVGVLRGEEKVMASLYVVGLFIMVL
jgi:hypothetical protein